MKVSVVSRKLIKPCTPTPESRKNYKLSFIDERNDEVEVGVLLFYISKEKRISHLEESLAKILAQFYPLAGRYVKKDHIVDCSDQGVEFVEAEALDVELIHLIEESKMEKLKCLLPRKSNQVDEAIHPVLLIQITDVKRGGLAIGVSVWHKIFDAASVGTFIAAWSNASNPRPVGKITISPSFDSATWLPGKNQIDDPDEKPTIAEASKFVAKRFSFNKEAITSLRSKLMRPNDGKGVLSSSRRGFSRVRVVSALIAKALIGVDRAKFGEPRPCIIAQAVNIRGRTIPPLPKHSCGNLAILSFTRCMAATETKDMGFEELVYVQGDAIDKSIADFAEILSLGEDGLNNIIVEPVVNAMKKSLSGEVNIVWFTDWSKFGFYEADFGWGKPVWASIVPQPFENLTVLMDNKEGDGIEAWVHLNHHGMSVFEQDQEIRLFTT